MTPPTATSPTSEQRIRPGPVIPLGGGDWANSSSSRVRIPGGQSEPGARQIPARCLVLEVGVEPDQYLELLEHRSGGQAVIEPTGGQTMGIAIAASRVVVAVAALVHGP